MSQRWCSESLKQTKEAELAKLRAQREALRQEESSQGALTASMRCMMNDFLKNERKLVFTELFS